MNKTGVRPERQKLLNLKIKGMDGELVLPKVWVLLLYQNEKHIFLIG